MAVRYNKCGGIIPDVMFDGDRNDCKNHRKPEINVHYKKDYLGIKIHNGQTTNDNTTK